MNGQFARCDIRDLAPRHRIPLHTNACIGGQLSWFRKDMFSIIGYSVYLQHERVVYMAFSDDPNWGTIGIGVVFW